MQNATQAVQSNVAAAVAAAIVPPNMDNVKASGVGFARSEIGGEESVKALAIELGDSPTFARWNVVFDGWKPAYKAERKCSDEAADKAAQRMAARLSAAFGLEKPKAEGGKKMAESREKKKAAIDAAIAEHGGNAVKLAKAALVAMEAGDPDKALSLQAAAQAASKAAKKAESAKLADRFDAVLKALKEAKKAGNAAILAAIEKALKSGKAGK